MPPRLHFLGFPLQNLQLISTMTPASIFNPTPRPSFYSKSTYCQSLPKLANSCRDLPLMTTCQTSKVAVTLHAVSSQSNYVTNAVSCSSTTTISKEDGIGIVKFLKGQSFLVTGATGLLGKVLIEKMLRTAPGIGKIYVLVNANDEKHALQRVISEIIECELFEKVKEIHGSKYYDFMRSKLVPVAGDVGEPDLGISNHDNFSNIFSKQVDVIIHCAANTNFHERYDVALNVNTKGPSRLMNFANKCDNLRLFLHVSTAFVNGERKGIVMEKPFKMGDTISALKLLSQSTSNTTLVDLPKLDVDHEIYLASDLLKRLHENEVAERMKEFGLMRAKKYGWADTYTFSKAMGEMRLISKKPEQVALVIVRPSIIESTYSEPFPGWIQGNRMLDPLILSYGKGLLPGYIGDPNCVIDVVPVDMVVNTMLSAMAKHGADPSPDLDIIYHATSSAENPVTLQDILQYSLHHFKSSPVIDSKNNKIDVTEMEFFSSMDDLSKYMISKEVAETEKIGDGLTHNNTAKLRARIMNNLLHMAMLHKPYLLSQPLFDNKNSQKLMDDMSVEEQQCFPLNMKSINWQYYFSNVHVPAIKRLFARSS